MRRFSKLIDAAIMTVLCVFSGSISYELLTDLRATTLVEYVPPAAMLACGHGLTDPVSPTPELLAFLRRERPSLSCSEVVGDGRSRIASQSVTSTRYAAYSFALAFRAGGMTWSTLDLYLATMAGLSMALAYALFRLAVGPALATIGAVALIFSNHSLGVALEFRDFGKELWFIGAWLAIGWLIRRGRPHVSPAIYAPAAAAGAMLGVGIGFRADLFIIIPAVMAVILFALRGFDRADLAGKGIGAGVFVITFALAGAPILATYSRESSVSHVVVLGLMTPFTDALGLEPPQYDIGDLYADGFAASTIYAHAVLVDRDRALGRQGTPAYDRQGLSLLKDLGRRFPADFIVRALGAARQVIANPFDPNADREAGSIAALTRTPARALALRWRAAAAGVLRGHELVLIAAAFLAVAIRDRRLAVIAATLVLYFSGYSMLQFSRRHTFHLDIIPTGLVLVAISAGVTLAVTLVRQRLSGVSIRSVAVPFVKAMLLAAITGTAMVAAGAAGLALVRAWQQRHVTVLIERTLASPSVDLSVTRERASAGSTVLLRPDAGAWPPGPAGMLFHAEYLVIELGGSNCAQGIVPIVVKYSSVYRTTDTDYTRTFHIPVTTGSRLLVPIFELPGTSHFDGLAVPDERVACVHRVRRVSPPDAAPLPNLFAVLHANWRSMPLFQRLRDAPVPPGDLPLSRSER